MEQFRLRIRNEPKRGQIWELHLFPHQPRRQFREVDGRTLGSSSAPEAIYWLRQIADPYLLRAEAPSPITADEFGTGSEPRWLQHEDGMRMALAFSAARWLMKKKQRRMFFEGLKTLPSEVVLYWFTLCFYGYQQAAGRAALRTLLTHEEPEQPAISRDAPRKPKKRPVAHGTYGAPDPDKEARMQEAREALGEFTARSRKQAEQEISREGPTADPEKGARSKAQSSRDKTSKS